MPDNAYQELIAFLDRKFGEIDRRFEAMDRRFDAIEAKLTLHDRRFDTVEAKLTLHDRRFDAIEAKLVLHDRHFEGIQATLVEHDERFREVLGHFDHFYGRLERLEDEYQAILQALRRIENLLIDEKARWEILERSVEHLKQQVAALQLRIGKLEQRLQ
jgi:chromosome segregation ATPase